MRAVLPRSRRPLAALCIPPLLIACGGGGGGTAGALVLEEVRWGRLVEVRDLGWNLVAPNFVIGEWIQGDGYQCEFRQNLATGGQILRILAPRETPAFDAALASVEESLGAIAPGNGLPPLPLAMVPRNAALVLRFNQPIRTGSRSAQTVRVIEAGSTPQALEVRLFVDPRDPRRLVVDPVVSAGESGTLGIPPNAVGFPEAGDAISPNLELRIPTRRDPSIGQTTLLHGESGSTPEDDDPSDGADVVRAFRSGGRTSVTGDPHEGFLFDPWPPSIVGERPVSICAVEPAPEGRLEVSVGGVGPGPVSPEPGEALRQADALGLVIGVLSPPGGCPMPGSGVRLLVEPLTPAPIEPGSGALVERFSAGDETSAHWFVAFDPAASAPPTGGVDPSSMVRVRFSEPIDPATVLPNDNFGLTKVDPGEEGFDGLAPRDFAVGDLVVPQGAAELDFVPVVPLPHVEGVGEEMFFWIKTGPAGPRDFGGNPLPGIPFKIPFSLASAAASEGTGGFALRFTSVNESDFDLAGPDPQGKPEVAGQFVLGEGELRGRPVYRFSRTVDPGNAFVGVASPFTLPVLTPLTSYGSRLLTTWRHCDLGLSATETNDLNLDVEGLSWAPFQGPAGGGLVPGGPYDVVVQNVPGLVADTLPRLRIRLAHSHYFPDEALSYFNPGASPDWPLSGLDTTKFYPTNSPTSALPLGERGNPFAYWHWDPEMDGGAGGVRSNPPLDVIDGPYAINPGQAFTSPGTGSVMLPFPAFTQTYTWRDTGYPFALKGGPAGAGVEPGSWVNVFGSPRPDVYPAAQVPSAALPLLVEFRSYPGNALNLNGLQVSILAFGVGVGTPAFRVFSTGGFDAQGTLVQRDPDGNTPLGGFTPLSVPPGQPSGTSGRQIYWGRADFVVRVSRAFTHWFDLGPMETPDGPLFAPPVVGPPTQDGGTSTIVEFRGASGVAGTCATVTPTCDELRDASKANVYGVFLSSATSQAPTTRLTGVAPPFTANNPALSEWTNDLARLNGKRYLQMRFTFTSDVETGEVGRLSAVAVGFRR